MKALSELRKLVVPPDLAIDLGTANTRLYTQRHGLLADEPTLVQHAHGTVTAVGIAAARAFGMDPSVKVIAALQAGYVTDPHAAGTLLRTLLHEHAPGVWSLGSRFIRALVCVPSDVGNDDRQNLLAAVKHAGIAVVIPISQALAAAIGAGLDIASPYAQLLIDIGAGKTEIAVVRAGTLLHGQTLPIASGDLHRALQQNAVANEGMLLSLRDAELLTRAVGVTGYQTEERIFQLRGQELATRQYVNFCLSSYALAEALLPAFQQLSHVLHTAIQNLAPDLSCEVIESGLMLTGGGALLPGLPERLAQLTGFNVRVAAQPLHATILGAGQMLQVSAATGLWAQSA